MPTGQLRGEIDVFKLGLLLRRSGLTPRGITMKYRPEIDGLRAVAVLPIIFFHAGFTWMSGGFVGVDVFFVISGYLITTIILNELDEGRFSIVQFYERRARRILPALFLVLGCCVPVATWLLLPDQLIGFSKSLASVISFLSNVYFRGQINYFARSSEEEPLLHTWSLAVEEQYYLLFPVLATLLWKSRRAGFFVATLLIALSSFLYADSQSLLQPDKAFFDTRMRVWELFIGSLVATYILRWRKAEPGRSVAEFGSALGLGMIVWACLNYVQSTPFPGRHALVPTIGAALVILFASPATHAGSLLSCKPAVGIGLISYSAYLWHQPIFAFALVTSRARPSEKVFQALLVLTLVLAYVSWRFVEQPFRDRKRFGRKWIFTFSVAGIAVFATVAALGYHYNGLPSRFPQRDADLLVSFEERGQYVMSRHQSYQKAGPFDSKSGFKLLIIGDSYSQDLVNVLHEGQLLRNANIRVRYIPKLCQVYQGDEPLTKFIKPGESRQCSDSNYYDGLKELVAEADAVLVALSWQKWAAERLAVSLERLGITSRANYIVIGVKSVGYINRAAYTRMSSSEKSAYRNPVASDRTKLNLILAQSVGDSHVVDLQALICGPSAERCPLFDEQGALLSHDGYHLTAAGARYLGERLAKDPVFARLLSAAER